MRSSPSRCLAATALLLAVAVVAGCSSTPSPRGEAAPPAFAPLAVPSRAVEPAEDYLIGPRDVLTVGVLDLVRPGEVSTLEVEVSAQGDIAAPFVGNVPAAGKTVPALRALLAQALARFLVDPQVSVSVKEYRSRRIGVMGAVAKPAIYFLNRNRVTLMEALALAGGLSKEAGTRAFVILPPPSGSPRQGERPGTAVARVERIEVDLIALLLGGELEHDLPIEPGSVVQVPPAQEFFVSGYVNRSGAYPYQRPTTVSQAIAVGGGLHERKASPSAVTIRRPTAEGTQVIEVDLGEIAAGQAPDVPVYPGDSIEAGRTIAWAIYSEFTDIVIGRIGAGFSLGGL